MIEIKVNVEVDLSERAATLLRLKQPEDSRRPSTSFSATFRNTLRSP